MKKQNEFNDFLTLAIKTTETAGNIVMSDFENASGFTVKPDGTLVTKTDIKLDKLIKKSILNAYPEHNIFSEESEKINNNSEYTWFIDPLDGTHNFIYGLPLFAVSIGLSFRDKMIVGVVHIPVIKRTYYACRGYGAFVNGKRISVSTRSEQTIISHDASLSKDTGQKLRIIRDMVKKAIKRLRILGSACVSLSFVASGVFDAYVSQDIKPYDIAAGCLIVEEAGGKVTDFKGGPWTPYTEKIIASNGLIHDKILGILSA